MRRAVFAVECSEPVFELVFAVLVAHLVVAAVFAVECVTLLLVGKLGLGVLVGQIIGVDFVERGGEGFLKREAGVVEIGLRCFVVPFQSVPVEKRQVDRHRAAQHGHVERAFGLV